jgi:hypothetical protein
LGFMLVYLITYRRTKSAQNAVEEVAALHTTYNLMVLGIAVFSILILPFRL